MPADVVYDIDTLHWYRSLLSVFDLSIAELPEIRESAPALATDLKESWIFMTIAGVMGDSRQLYLRNDVRTGMAESLFWNGSSIVEHCHEKKYSENVSLRLSLGFINRKTSMPLKVLPTSRSCIGWLKASDWSDDNVVIQRFRLLRAG
jgi:glycerol kinase